MNEEKLVNKLIELDYTIASAESCTGGMFASTIINVANASKVINSSIVTYSNEAKMKYCNVGIETLNNFGAVSIETAREMAVGIANECNSNIGVAISGIAGPGGGTPNKPVGTVCFGLSVNGEVYSYKKLFAGDRLSVRQQSVDFAINELINLLEK